MTMQLVHGEIPWDQPRAGTGRTLTADSFTGRRSGLVPVAYGHWRNGDHIMANSATWAVTATGLGFMHVLDDSIPYEAGILAAVKVGKLFWSYGDGATPTAARAAIAAWGDRRVDYAVKPLQGVTFDHVSYVAIPAWEQQPIKWVGLELGDLATVSAHNSSYAVW